MLDTLIDPAIKLARIGIGRPEVVVPGSYPFRPGGRPTLDQRTVRLPISRILPLSAIRGQHRHHPWMQANCRGGFRPVVSQCRQITRLTRRGFPSTSLVENSLRHLVHKGKDQIRVVRPLPEKAQRLNRELRRFRFVKTNIIINRKREALAFRIFIEVVQRRLCRDLHCTRMRKVRLRIRAPAPLGYPAATPNYRKQIRFRFIEIFSKDFCQIVVKFIACGESISPRIFRVARIQSTMHESRALRPTPVWKTIWNCADKFPAQFSRPVPAHAKQVRAQTVDCIT